MNMGIDIDGTLDRNPEFFRQLLSGWTSGKRILLTARPKTEWVITMKHLEELRIYDGIHYDHLEMYPDSYLFMSLDNEPLYMYDVLKVKQYVNMDHRDQAIRAHWMGANPDLKEDDPITSDLRKPPYWPAEEFTAKIAQWKVDRCKEFEISTMFEDNQHNVDALNAAGVYAVLVNRNHTAS